MPGRTPVVLEPGDFVLIPFAERFTLSSLDRSTSGGGETVPIEIRPGVFRLGEPTGEPEVRKLIGYGMFQADDLALLVSLLPPMVHVRGEERLTTLVKLIDDETRAHRPARDVVLTRLLEVLLIEALRTSSGPSAPPGLLRGLSDPRLAAALRAMHERPAEPWTVAWLAREAGLSRSAFFDRFKREVGVAPIEYLATWRMSLAKKVLREEKVSISEVARRAGYSSASTFSEAFAKFTHRSPTAYVREQAASG